ncbi:MAG: type II toxin-antitoxin system HicB family antitoxin [Desulfobacterales bacterium]|nr:type II toxin-antitoxin system HicB family antitoxin [Desulfobacterales bacterium]
MKKPVKAHTSAGCPAAGKESAQQGRLPIKIEKGEKYYVASCPAFDVASQGKTVNKAKSNLGEALTAFFISCIE